MPGEPRLLLSRGLAVVPDDGALIVQGSGQRHVFRGRSATTLLPRLFTLLDGSRSRPEIAAELGLSPARLDRPLDLLRERGLLELAAPARRGAAPDHVVDYHSRRLDGSGGHPGTGALLDALAGFAVHVAGPARVSAAVAADLRECGIGDAATGPFTEARAAALAAAERSLVVVVEDRGDPELPARTAALCGPLGLPVLRAAADSAHLEIGPCFLPGFTACPACLARGRADAGWTAQEAADTAAEQTLAGLTTAEVLALASGAPAGPAMVVTRIGLDGWNAERYLVVPHPDCPCDDIGGDGPEPDLGDIQLWAIEHAAPPTLRAGAPARAVQERWRTLQEDRPAYHAHPRRRLPEERLPIRGMFGAGEPPAAPAALDRTLIADLLARVAGLRRGPGESASQRWVPTGGQLGSVELYLVTDSGFPGLPGTVFRYDDLAHALISMRADALPLTAVLADTDLAAEGLDAVLVFTAAHERLTRKYHDFAYRLTHLDAGCATTQLAVVAAAHGLSVRFATRWGEALAETLDLTPDGQYVTAVAGLHRGETCR